MTLETEVAALTSATTALLDAVNVRKTVLDQTVTDATAQADAASASAGNAAASAGAASTSQTAAATSQAQALAYKDAAAASAASAASAVLGQTTSKLVLDVVDQTVFASTTLVDAVIYETQKDSDGGNWVRKHRAGNSFPQKTRMLFVATTTLLNVYDLTDPTTPLLKSFAVGANNPVFAEPKALAAGNGVLAVATSAGLAVLNLITGSAIKHTTGADVKYKALIATAGAGWQ